MSVESTKEQEINILIEQLPIGDYSENYQPVFEDKDALAEAMHELSAMGGVTTPFNIGLLQAELTDILTTRNKPIIITGRCAEPIKLQQPIEELVTDALSSYDLVRSCLPKALVIQRNRGQNAKPRSSMYETLSDGSNVLSYMGDSINDADKNKRLADPSRMVAAAVQARDLENGIKEVLSQHIPAAHEALLLPYELPFVRKHDGKEYLLSADLPWIGERTNDPDGHHVKLMSRLANPIGIKVGQSAAENNYIKRLKNRLNPESVPGRLVMMIRVGYDKLALNSVMHAIATDAPESIILYDLHGVTATNEHGEKIRAVSDIKAQIEELGMAARESNIAVHGVHLETINDSSRHECVGTPMERPTHPGGVDPQLNPNQTKQVINKLLTIM